MKKLCTTVLLLLLLTMNSFSAKYVTSTFNIKCVGYGWSGYVEHSYKVQLTSEKLLLDDDKYYLIELEQIDFGTFTVWYAHGYNSDKGYSKVELWCYPDGKRTLYIKYPNIEYKYEMLKVVNY